MRSSFRRIVRYRVQQQNGEMPTPEELRQILREQIRGIEINEEAVCIAAFSLYLALLHYQEPPTIRTKRGYPILFTKKGSLKMKIITIFCSETTRLRS